MNEKLAFLKAFLKSPMKVGSVAPSSPDLAKAMLKDVTPSADNIVLELGIGTGAITRHIRSIIPDENSYLGIELDEALIDKARCEMPELKMVCGNALEIAKIHQESGLGKIGYIICSLPFVTIPHDVAQMILIEVDKLMDKGCLFRIFTYAHGFYIPSAVRLREFMNERHGEPATSKLILRNLPPAYTLSWTAK